MKQTQTIPPSIGIAELLAVSENAAAVVAQVRTSMLAPEARKSPPKFNSAQLAELCGIEKTRLQYLA